MLLLRRPRAVPLRAAMLVVVFGTFATRLRLDPKTHLRAPRTLPCDARSRREFRNVTIQRPRSSVSRWEDGEKLARFSSFFVDFVESLASLAKDSWNQIAGWLAEMRMLQVVLAQ